MTIWKYELEITDLQRVAMPKGAKILSVGKQGAYACLWAMVDENEDATEERCIEIVGTGNPMHRSMGFARRFIGTVVMTPFVWHVFERVN
ncbi:hypothetical protein [Kordiimonas sp.]|uniref:DUF7352 domain-containing protein n=1 Tax=Kordiimonas sp. TaxID=1970157 RepID=UPI003A95A947